MLSSGRRHNRKFDEARLPGRTIDALRRLLVVGRGRAKDARYERLRLAIVEREPTRLHLHHDAMTRQENVVRRRRRETVRRVTIRHDGLRTLVALAITAGENVG